MNKDIFKYAIALTGGIATGKSTVCNLLKKDGFLIIDADLIAHRLLDLHYKNIAAIFGEEYVEEKKVLRKKLGSIIFSDEKNKLKLESFIHPLIQKEIEKEASVLEKMQKVYFIDIPLFYEKMHYPISKCLLIYTPKDTQLKRLMNRDNIDEELALLKISNQMDIEEKKNKADYIIDNSRNLQELKNEVVQFTKEIL